MVTYNALDFIKRAVESIESLTNYLYELIIVDNNSDNVTKKYLLSLTHKHKIILNTENKLFAAANNQGILASDPTSKYLLLLNSDIEALHPNWLTKMVELMELKPTIGIAGPKHNYKPIAPIYGAIDGWCFLFKREALNQVGLFDADKFPWNGSPNDFTIRAFKKGWTYKHFTPKKDYIRHYGKRSRIENLTMSSDIPYDYEILLKEHGIHPVRRNLLFESLRKKCYSWFGIFERFYETRPF